MTTGTVQWFNTQKGFGFIAPDDRSEDVFAHYTALSTESCQTLEMIGEPRGCHSLIPATTYQSTFRSEPSKQKHDPKITASPT